MNCTFPDCPKKLDGKHKKYCAGHQRQLHRHGELKPIREMKYSTCRLCDRPAHIKSIGLCRPHYYYSRNGRIVDPQEERACQEEGCNVKHYAKDMCYGHYAAHRVFLLAEEVRKLT